jgi:peptide-methionine (R)-S-oxide reductase
MRKVEKTDAEWREQLDPEQYRILRQAGTERPYTGEYTDLEDEGVYRCAGCGEELFTNDTKFHSGCGWPAFYAPSQEGTVQEKVDDSFGMRRTEVLCQSCGGHLGHVFADAPHMPGGQRYCINSKSLQFEPKK